MKMTITKAVDLNVGARYTLENGEGLKIKIFDTSPKGEATLRLIHASGYRDIPRDLLDFVGRKVDIDITPAPQACTVEA